MSKALVMGDDLPRLSRGVTSSRSRRQKQRCNRCWSTWHRR